ncbi:MAG: CoB--CoM heterodisulfide reductase iron-sulfur subunit B family protein [Spirochaetes bacterium]|nr:CoB--CoM heterodisulfide reductase iron-sulfur subunit B family protein [Spirochaetota bacterium]
MAEKKYAYYSGCSQETSSKEYDISLRAVMKALDVELVEPEGWSCCGSTPAHTVNHVLAAALAARNLALVEKMNMPVLTTPCPSCLTAFKEANHRMENDSFKKDVNSLLDNPYNGTVDAKSSLQIIYEDIGLETIASKVKYVFTELKVAPYYGCIMNRPPALAKFDDPENPIAMDKILSALGLNVCDFAFKTECCGAGYGYTKKDMMKELTYKVLDMARDAGANCIAVACPVCQMNLDLNQKEINKDRGSDFNMPVIYFTQLMGLAFGCSPKELAIKKLIVNPDKLLKNRMLKSETDKGQDKEKLKASA